VEIESLEHDGVALGRRRRRARQVRVVDAVSSLMPVRLWRDDALVDRFYDTSDSLGDDELEHHERARSISASRCSRVGGGAGTKASSASREA
jgi:hypothetical protein